LASGSQVSRCPDHNYLIQESLALYWQSKEDARFQDARAEADKLLSRMLEKMNSYGYGHAGNSVENVDDQSGLRWGDF
jgi:hypothetical protein